MVVGYFKIDFARSSHAVGCSSSAADDTKLKLRFSNSRRVFTKGLLVDASAFSALRLSLQPGPFPQFSPRASAKLLAFKSRRELYLHHADDEVARLRYARSLTQTYIHTATTREIHRLTAHPASMCNCLLIARAAKKRCLVTHPPLEEL